MLRTQILQAPGTITPDHVKARTIRHLSNESTSSHPYQGHHHAPTGCPPPLQNQSKCGARHQSALRAAPASHLGSHHRTKVGVSLLTPVPGKPRCLCQTHAAHARATGVTIPTLAPGAPRISHLPHRAPWTLPSCRTAHTAPESGARPAAPAAPLTSSQPQGSARRRHRDRHLHPGLPKAPIH